MKKLFIFLFTFFLCVAVHSQKKYCATDEITNALLKNDYGIKVRIDAIDNTIVNTATNSLKSPTEPMINVPIVVYVVHDNQPLGVGSNISDLQVQAQLDALNNYYNPYGINFCLGTKVGNVSIPSGLGVQNTPGIIHYNSTTNSIHYANTTGIQGLNNLIIGNNTYRNNFLRIWVVKSINGIASPPNVVAGYSMFPNASPIFDGVVIRSDVFGNGTSNLIPGLNLGKTLVHEVGHFFGLYHTFQGGCSGMSSSNCQTMGDRVCDTPPVQSPNFNCVTGTDSCIEPVSNIPDLINNYMDYGNDNCINNFTSGQILRLKNIISLTRSELISDDNLVYTGVTCTSPSILTAKFTPSSYYSCLAGNSISFSPLQSSLNYSWNFGDPASGVNNTSNLSNPSHTFTTSSNSPYTVTLTVSNGSNSAVFSVNIYISNCSVISGAESNWYTSLSNAFNFTTGIPVVNNITLPTAPSPYNGGTFAESCAFQSNTSGTILFYTNGMNIYNGNTNAVVNSILLKGNGSSKSGTLIVPNPANANQYYVFTKDAFYGLSNNGLNGFNYSIVNVSGTTVNMVSTNIPITIPLGYLTGNNSAVLGGEGITAAQKCNGYWIVTTLKKASGNFIVVYSLTSSGLSFNSEIQLPFTDSSDCFSSLKFSPDGNKILFVNYSNFRTNYLFDFNKFTGILSNLINLNISSYGASFSPDSKILYADSGNQTVSIPAISYIYQYNLLSSNIPNSKKIIATTTGYTGEIEIGPDNKLYQGFFSKNKFAIIHNPNQLVDDSNPNACNFTFDGINANSVSASGMPNLINCKIGTAYNNTITTSIISCNTYRFFPNACDTSFNWNFGDSASGVNNTSTATIPTHIFSSDGTYIITLRNSSNVIIATTSITVGFTAPIITGSSTICTSASGGSKVSNNSIVLLPGQTALWSISSGTGTISGLNNQSDITIIWSSAGGAISVTVTNASGCTRTVVKTISETSINCTSNTCPDNLSFTVTETSVLATYQASNTIVTNTNYLVNSGSEITLTAGNSITFSPNSEIKSGSNYIAKIQACTLESGKQVKEKISEIENVQENNSLIIYPNPTENIVNINSKDGNIKSVFINSIDGKNVLNQNLSNTNLMQLDISNYERGIYLVTVEIENGNIIKSKIIKK